MSDPLPLVKAIQKVRPVGILTRIPVNHKERQVARYPGVCHIEGSHFERKVALTFDDGPSALTEPLLDLLKELGVKGTFFWLGQNLKHFDASAMRARAEGHTFGNHSLDHSDFTKISIDEVLHEQIGKTQLIYRDILGIEPSLVRPPFGKVADELIEALCGMGLKIIFWSIDGGDWIEENNSADHIVGRVVSMLHEEAIILMHDGGSAGGDTIQAVRSIIRCCRDRGYEFVTVHDLIGAEESLS
jgi:peptidoglycan/xylan/chitin deacetylase (PgdA/CDA1 family)